MTRQESYLIFTAYNLASQYQTNGECQLALGSLIPLNPVFSVLQPAKVNSTDFQSVAKDSFTNHIGFSTCSGSGEEVTAFPVTSGPHQIFTQSISTGTNGQNPSSTHSVSKLSSGSYQKRVEVANGVAIPIAFLGLALLGFLLYRCRKNQKTLKEEDPTSQDLGSPQEDSQPYLQQKAELEAEEKRKHELEARERTYEIGSEGRRYELQVEEEDLMIRTRQELRGEEHSTELGVSR